MSVSQHERHDRGYGSQLPQIKVRCKSFREQCKKINKLCLFVRVGGFACPSVCENKKEGHTYKNGDKRLHNPKV